MSPTFGRVVTAMVTPFDERGDLDLDAAAELAQWLVENGSDGLALAGTTGESPTLKHAETLALFRRVREAVPGRLGHGSSGSGRSRDQPRPAATNDSGSSTSVPEDRMIIAPRRRIRTASNRVHHRPG